MNYKEIIEKHVGKIRWFDVAFESDEWIVFLVKDWEGYYRSVAINKKDGRVIVKERVKLM